MDELSIPWDSSESPATPQTAIALSATPQPLTFQTAFLLAREASPTLTDDVTPPLTDNIAPALAKAIAALPGKTDGAVSSETASLEADPKADETPPKPEKNRSHICELCSRGFARLEHLKRHERSHTKEKPFSCSECPRCFSRRDLLLRHQQKLHNDRFPPAKPRNARRASGPATSSTTQSMHANRVRKNSANAGPTSGMTQALSAALHSRPRASTLGHLDLSGFGIDHDERHFSSSDDTSVQTPPNMPAIPQAPRQRMSEGAMPFETFNNFSLSNFQTEQPSLGATNPYPTQVAPMRHFAFPDLTVPIQHQEAFQDHTTVNPAQLHSAFAPESPLDPFADMTTFSGPTAADVWSPTMWNSPIAGFNDTAIQDVGAGDMVSMMNMLPDHQLSIAAASQLTQSWETLLTNPGSAAPRSMNRFSIDTTAAASMAGLNMSQYTGSLDTTAFDMNTYIPQGASLDMNIPMATTLYAPPGVSNNAVIETQSELY